MDDEQWENIVNWLTYRQYPTTITERESKKAWKKKMKKYQYMEDKDLLFYHLNKEVLICDIIYGVLL